MTSSHGSSVFWRETVRIGQGLVWILFSPKSNSEMHFPLSHLAAEKRAASVRCLVLPEPQPAFASEREVRQQTVMQRYHQEGNEGEELCKSGNLLFVIKSSMNSTLSQSSFPSKPEVRKKGTKYRVQFTAERLQKYTVMRVIKYDHTEKEWGE